MISYKRTKVDEAVRNINSYRRMKYNLPPEETNNIYMIFREVEAGKVPSTLYVGKTKRDLATRLAQHIGEIKRAEDGKIEWSLKLVWMKQVMQEKCSLKIALLNKVPASKALEYENEWIVYLGIAGFKMMTGDNSHYYNKGI